MAHSIGDCLQSLVSQGADEVVVVDGNSTDGTSQIVDRFSLVHLYDERKGVPAARNIATNNARGEYLVIIDADQRIPQGFLSALAYVLDSCHYDAIFCKEIWLGGSVWAQAQQASWLTVEMLRKESIYWPRILKKTLVTKAGGYDENMKGFEDFDLWNRIRRLNPKIFGSNLIIYSDASSASPLTALKRGIYSYVSVARYITKYPSEWLAAVTIAPIGIILDFAIGLFVAMHLKSVRLGVATFIVRGAMSIGRFFGMLLDTPLGRIFQRSQGIRGIARIPIRGK
jgi:glycosyltransferase involved in cell wall biosynthesis